MKGKIVQLDIFFRLPYYDQTLAFENRQIENLEKQAKMRYKTFFSKTKFPTYYINAVKPIISKRLNWKSTVYPIWGKINERKIT